MEDFELQGVEEVVDPYGKEDQEVRRPDRRLESVVRQLVRPPDSVAAGALEEVPCKKAVSHLERNRSAIDGRNCNRSSGTGDWCLKR